MRIVYSLSIGAYKTATFIFTIVRPSSESVKTTSAAPSVAIRSLIDAHYHDVIVELNNIHRTPMILP